MKPLRREASLSRNRVELLTASRVVRAISAIVFGLGWLVWFEPAPAAELIVRFAPGTVLEDAPDHMVQLSEGIASPTVQTTLANLGVLGVRSLLPQEMTSNPVRLLKSGATASTGDLTQLVVLDIGSESVAATIAEMTQQPWVVYAEPNVLCRLAAAPGDPLAANQAWISQSSGASFLQLAKGWDLATGDSTIRLAIIDSGVDFRNSDFGGQTSISSAGPKVVAGATYVPTSGIQDCSANDPDCVFHGTAVAGIAAALSNNRETAAGAYVGIAGVAGGWNYNKATGLGSRGCTIISQRITNDPTPEYDDLLQAIYEAADPSVFGAAVINLSLGFEGAVMQSMREALSFAARMQCVVVAAKGDREGGGTTDPFYPADNDASLVIAVGGIQPNGGRPESANYGGGIDVVAQSTEIRTTMPLVSTYWMRYDGLLPRTPAFSTHFYGNLEGTSFAAPQVTGLAGLLLSRAPTLHPEDVQGILKATATPQPGLPALEQGAGVPHAQRALESLAWPWSFQQLTASGGTVVESSSLQNASFVSSGDPGALSTGIHYVIRRKVVKTVAMPNPSLYEIQPRIWGRGAGATQGWFPDMGNLGPPNFETGFCHVSSVTSADAQLETYIFSEFTLGGQFMDHHPTSPANAVFAYSTLGKLRVPPAVVLDFQATMYSSVGLNLTWTAPGDDGSLGQAAEYDIHYSTVPIGLDEFEFALLPRVTTSTPSPSGTSEQVLLSGLTPATTYYFRMRTRDPQGVWSALSAQFTGTTSSDVTAPASITNLAGSAPGGQQSVTLTWTHPGDDGVTGQATSYDLRYAFTPITAGNFSTAVPVSPQPVPGTASTSAQYVFSPRDPCTTYYFAIKTLDEAHNASGLSNLATVQAVTHGCGGGGGDDDPPIVQGAGLHIVGGGIHRRSAGLVKVMLVLPDGQRPSDISIYNVTGRRVAQLEPQHAGPGRSSATWRIAGSGYVPAGVSLLRTTAGSDSYDKRIILLP